MTHRTDGLTRILGDELARGALDIQALLHKARDSEAGLGARETMELYHKLELLSQTREHLEARLTTRDSL
jgi:hypothetical protein